MNSQYPHFLAASEIVQCRIGPIDHVRSIEHSQSITFQLTGRASNHLLRIHAPLKTEDDLGFSGPAANESECTSWLRSLGTQILELPSP